MMLSILFCKSNSAASARDSSASILSCNVLSLVNRVSASASMLFCNKVSALDLASASAVKLLLRLVVNEFSAPAKSLSESWNALTISVKESNAAGSILLKILSI